ncbi:phosphoprotein [Qiongzhong bat virus]|uniref:Phosphoprotein n=1 Tax=Qiongzhong bat virus TaxID=2716752 RepID=A0A7S5S0U5_9RHAB|nr:phosphoprotein [Qiongzhong bat virus]
MDLDGNEEIRALMAQYPELPTALNEVAAISREVDAEDDYDLPSDTPRIDFDSDSDEDEALETEQDRPVSFKVDWDQDEFKLDLTTCPRPLIQDFMKETIAQLMSWVNSKIPLGSGTFYCDSDKEGEIRLIHKNYPNNSKLLEELKELENSLVDTSKPSAPVQNIDVRDKKIIILSRSDDPPWKGTLVQLAGSREKAHNPDFNDNTPVVDMVIWALMQGKQYNRFALRYQIEEAEFDEEED